MLGCWSAVKVLGLIWQLSGETIADEVDGSRSRHLGAKVWTLSMQPS